MRNELQRKIIEDFPSLFGKTGETLVCFGIETGDGWFQLIYDLCQKLSGMELPPSFIILQVKEKFGGLRFYVSTATDEAWEAIALAEDESERTCEECGKPGKPRGGAWVRTLCEEC